MSKLTSIILTCYDHIQSSRNSSMAVSVALTRFTNPKEYELIVIDCEPKFPFNYSPHRKDSVHPVKIDKFIEVPEDPGYYVAMNIGAEQAKGDYLCFIENDVFVTPNWLPNLRWYLEKDKVDAVFPHQAPDSYETYMSYCNKSMEDGINGGCEEQGLVLIKRSAFNKIGGFDKNLSRGYGWRNFLEQMNDNNVRFGSTIKSTISHICGMTYFNNAVFETEKHNMNQTIENTYLDNK